MYLFCPLGYIALTHTHRHTEDILLGLTVTITWTIVKPAQIIICMDVGREYFSRCDSTAQIIKNQEEKEMNACFTDTDFFPDCRADKHLLED